MEIREAHEGEITVLAPDGSLTGTEETSALEAKLAAVQKAGGRYLVIDCGSVGQLASVAVRALLLASRKAGRAQGRLVLCRMTPKVRKAFAISGFDKDFAIVGTREEALRLALEPAAAAKPAPPPSPRTPAPVPEASRPAAAAFLEPAPESAPSGGPPPAARCPEGNDAPFPPSPPVPDPREALANALLDAFGVRVLRPAAPGATSVAARDLEPLADSLLAALGGRRA
jgi:anti-anti-sigma factor